MAYLLTNPHNDTTNIEWNSNLAVVSLSSGRLTRAVRWFPLSFPPLIFMLCVFFYLFLFLFAFAFSSYSVFSCFLNIFVVFFYIFVKSLFLRLREKK